MATASLAPTGFAPTLADRLWPQSAETSPAFRALRFVGLALIGTLLLTLSAKIKVPFYPVEMTMQTFMILALAAAYGRNLAVATVLLYLAEGAMGLPVFTGSPERGIGLAYMMGPTGGYLAGFIVCAAIVGAAADRGWSTSIPKMALAMLVGLTALFVLGVAWLSTLIGFNGAITHGVLPFLLGDATKLALAALAVPAGMALLKPRD
ncbi:MAG: biotin transporter BioY [Hyphomicrobiales bacterium]|jgi:biotin transport system substrate-specific component